MRSLGSLSELTPDQKKRVTKVVLRTLDANEHFGGAGPVEMHLALLDASRWIGVQLGVAITIDVLDAMTARGYLEKFEGREFTTWKVAFNEADQVESETNSNSEG